MPAHEIRIGRTGKLGEVFRIAFPLIVSSGIFAFKLFCDRVMLAWHAERSIAAALAAGMTAFMLCSFFLGIANYSNAFVAQYSGAERYGRTGLAVWQALLFSLAAGLFLAALGWAVSPFFHLIGHAPELAAEEEAYFLALSSGAVFALLNASLMCFWTGRNKTWTVVVVSFSSALLNVIMNWALIFGAGGTQHMAKAGPFLSAVGNGLNRIAALIGAPDMGIAGAGLATVGSDALSALALLALFLRRNNRREYGTLPARVFDAKLMLRMLRYGFGNGMQMFLDVGAFAVFNLLMGLYGLTALGANVGAASGIAISVNGGAFIPMLGVGAAASIMVGHGIGSQNLDYAIKAVRSARILMLCYMATMCFIFSFHSEFLVSIFAPGESMSAATREMATHFIRFSGAYCIADGFFILYGNAIRGAGDTRFSMYVMGFAGWFLFAIPCAIAFLLGAGPYVPWIILLVYCFTVAGIFYWRYRQGKWMRMRVIEETGSRRRIRPASVRLSTPVAVEEAVFTIPGGEVEGADGE